MAIAVLDCGAAAASASQGVAGSVVALGNGTPFKECKGLNRIWFDYRPKSGWSQQGRHRHFRDTYGSSNSVKTSVHGQFHALFQALSDDRNEARDAIAAQARDLLSDFNEGDGEQSFFDRLALAWRILFLPSRGKRRSSFSNADIAKQRLKMILISDRCSVNDDAKRRIVNNIVGALSDFVEIESEDKVELTVSSDPSLGTVYSVTVPVRRVKPEYQEYSRELQNVALAQDFAHEFRTLDIKLEYPDAVDVPQSSLDIKLEYPDAVDEPQS